MHVEWTCLQSNDLAQGCPADLVLQARSGLEGSSWAGWPTPGSETAALCHLGSQGVNTAVDTSLPQKIFPCCQFELAVMTKVPNFGGEERDAVSTLGHPGFQSNAKPVAPAAILMSLTSHNLTLPVPHAANRPQFEQAWFS